MLLHPSRRKGTFHTRGTETHNPEAPPPPPPPHKTVTNPQRRFQPVVRRRGVCQAPLLPALLQQRKHNLLTLPPERYITASGLGLINRSEPIIICYIGEQRLSTCGPAAVSPCRLHRNAFVPAPERTRNEAIQETKEQPLGQETTAVAAACLVNRTYPFRASADVFQAVLNERKTA